MDSDYTYWAHTMNGGFYSVKKTRKGIARKLLREAADRVVNRDSQKPDEYDVELRWGYSQPFGSRQLTKAPRRKQ